MATKGLVGHINELKLKEDDFNGWVERFELYVQLNEVNAHKRKLLFLTLVGNEGYSLLRDLCLPVKPLDKSYDNLKTLLSEYMNPKPNVVTERFKFKERRQGNETIIQFVTVLKKMSEFCAFGTHLEDALRDQLIWGIKDQNIQKRLLSEESLNFKRCVELSVAMEAATNDVNQLQNQNQVEVLYQEPKSELLVGSRTQRKATSTSLQQKRSELVCYCCGAAGHVKPKCKFKDLICTNCNKKGHLKKVCKNDSLNVNNLEQDEVGMMESLYNLAPLQVNFIKPYCLELVVDGKNILFQVDTGSGISVISVDSVKQFKIGGLDKLIKTNLKLKAYNGNIINPLGILSVVIGYKGMCKTLDLYVVNEGGPPIMGRDWITVFKVFPKELGLNTLSVQSMVDRFPGVFSNSLGCYKNKTFELVLKSDSKPIFCRPRIIPFSLKDKVSLELDRMIADGLLEPVESSDWATPIVPVVKVDGSIRLCGDYKVTVNKSLVVDRYPIPRVNELLSMFQGATKFCTLDLCQAYQQLPLSAESQKITTITTHRGLFLFKRVPYGVASAPGLLQREMENILSGLEGVGCFYDDVVIAGKDDKEVTERLLKVLERFESAGLTVKASKCKLLQDSVTFLGHCVDKDGLHIPENRVKAIAQVKTPENVHQLKAFLGLVNYYGRFFRNLSSLASPLYSLLKANVKFCWGLEQNKAFSNIKNHLLSKTVLTHYDTNLELVLACDASPMGIGAVLSHRFPNKEEKPIAFASRTLNKSEQGYSQLDKEALALVYGVKYFHQYLYGRPFILKTDHKPLISIFGEKKGIPVMAAHRLQRYAVFLAGYTYTIEFVKGEDNGNADALSRLPLEGVDMINHEFCSNFFINLITTNVQGIADLDICEEIQKDKVLKKVFLWVMSGKWPNSSKELSEDIKPYFNRRNELAIEQGMLLWGHRLVIPLKFREGLLMELHSSHLGTVKMKAIARSYMWWPNIDKEIDMITKECSGCVEYSDNPPKSILHNWPWPDGPAQRIHLDFLGPINGKMFVVIIDAHSKWAHVRFMNNITTESTIKILREYFSLWGIPAKLVTDNGPSLVSEVMEEFLAKNGVFHVKTPPYNPASNGAAENLVRTFKNFLKKSGMKSDVETEIARFMLSYNSTKHCATGVTPAELHIGRRLFTSFDRLVPRAKYSYNNSMLAAKRVYKGGRVKRFEIGDNVMCRNYASGAKWIRGTIVQILSPVTYMVQIAEGEVWKRHINQLLDTNGVVTNSCVKTLTNSGLGPKDQLPLFPVKEVGRRESVVEDSLETEKLDVPKLWRSDRVKKTPNRLNL